MPDRLNLSRAFDLPVSRAREADPRDVTFKMKCGVYIDYLFISMQCDIVIIDVGQDIRRSGHPNRAF